MNQFNDELTRAAWLEEKVTAQSVTIDHLERRAAFLVLHTRTLQSQIQELEQQVKDLQVTMDSEEDAEDYDEV